MGIARTTSALATTRSGHGRRLLAALVAGCALLAVAVAVSGCGASATLDPVAQAAEVTRRQVGAHVSFSEQISAPQLPNGSVQITATGYIAWRQRAETLNMNFSGMSGLAGSSGASSAQMVLLYPMLYMKIPALAGHLPEGKQWMQIDIPKAGQAAGISASELSSADQWDPSQFLDYLRASSGSVIPVDKETLDGVSTTHYRIDLQVDRIIEHLSSEQQAAAKAGLEKLGVANELPVEVWIDGQGLVRRETLSFGGGGSTDAAGAGAGSSGASSAIPGLSGTVTVEFTNFGPVPPVTAPPANEVFDATNLGSAGGLGSNG